MATFITGGYGQIGSWIAYLLAKEGFGYEPRYDLEAGIQDYADWIRKQIEGS